VPPIENYRDFGEPSGDNFRGFDRASAISHILFDDTSCSISAMRAFVKEIASLHRSKSLEICKRCRLRQPNSPATPEIPLLLERRVLKQFALIHLL
jgi:hypothetical protein